MRRFTYVNSKKVYLFILIEGIVTNEIFAGSNVFRTIPYPYAIPGTTREIECAVGVHAEEFQNFLVDRLMTYFAK
jgi:hypothetical protein